MKSYKRVLAIAGSDSGGGAGIQADIKSISANGCFAASAITAVTVQNTIGVQAVHELPADIVSGQISAVLSDIGADAIKIGMLPSADVMKAVARTIRQFHPANIVLDPVMVATSGDRLMSIDAVQTLKQELMPMARVITPNIPEAEVLAGGSIREQNQLAEIAQRMAEEFHTSVLLKAGHLVGNVLTDVLYDNESRRCHFYESARIPTLNTHGTGCTLSSALAAQLAKGLALPDAVGRAEHYLHQAIKEGADYRIGHGHGPVHHFFDVYAV
ncbi:MAG: bifunctional hydroxymethylpyrimidine kinase/phosphomethylpyrimidine kinase [Bacteroidales bacterium]|nr:bifunctional hydroxymethylpyrimidine kinase/phosphomethylpyrimidine kinase [Bacteroidales bacterium]